MTQRWRTIFGAARQLARSPRRPALVIGIGSVVDLDGRATRAALSRLTDTEGGLEHDQAVFQRELDAFERQEILAVGSRSAAMEHTSAAFAVGLPRWLIELGFERIDQLGDTYPDILIARRITPVNYRGAMEIGEEFRSGRPVLIDLHDMDEADARRLVDFAAGLAFGKRALIRRIANRVFMLYGGTGTAEAVPLAAQSVTRRHAQSNEDTAAEVRSVLRDLAEAV